MSRKKLRRKTGPKLIPGFGEEAPKREPMRLGAYYVDYYHTGSGRIGTPTCWKAQRRTQYKVR